MPVLRRIWKPHLNLLKSAVIDWSCLLWDWDMELVVNVLYLCLVYSVPMKELRRLRQIEAYAF